MIGSEMWNIFSGYGLTVIPMFILVGEFVHYAGYNDSLYHATHRWFGHYRGGLAITTIMASAAFSAISGSNTATAATMSTVAIPSMKKYGYHPILNAGSVAAGATLGVLIPPSIVLVVYGIYTGQSIGKLFFGNVIPSVILTRAHRGDGLFHLLPAPRLGAQGRRKAPGRSVFRPFRRRSISWFCSRIIMYALFTGVVTATEAAAVSCTLGLIICLARRKLSWKGFLASINDTMRISCMVFMIIAGAVIFGRFLTLTRLPFEAAGWIGSLGLPRDDPRPDPPVLHHRRLHHGRLAFLLISLPIFYPLVVRMGYDPIWFGQVITIVTTMGAIMPPIGICCYVVAAMAKDIPLATVFRGALYYIPAYILTLILLAMFPFGTVLILSNLVR